MTTSDAWDRSDAAVRCLTHPLSFMVDQSNSNNAQFELFVKQPSKEKYIINLFKMITNDT